MLIWVLEMWYRGEPKIEWHVTDYFYQVADIMGHGYLMFHGDQIRSFAGYPFYGIGRRVLNWTQSIPEDFSVACHGHFHSAALWYVGKIPVISNGSFFTGDMHSMKRLGLDATPVQWLLFANKDYPMTASYQVYLP